MVITINYRLGVLGFISFQDDVVPGNYGILDQIQALKWVKENIQSFGGDPNLVTISGYSAGGSSASILILSPLASGLFQRAIVESGCSLAPWATYKPSKWPVPAQLATLIGNAIGCNCDDATSKLRCLRKVDGAKLFTTSLAIEDVFGGGLLLTPVVETKFGVLPDYPINMWSRNEFNHVDTIHGFTEAEGAAVIVRALPFPIRESEVVPALKFAFLQLNYLIPPQYMDRLTTKLIEIYSENHTHAAPFDANLQLITAISDLLAKGPALAEAKFGSEMAPEKKHYVYQYSHRPSMSFMPEWVATGHLEDVPFIFGVDLKAFQVIGRSPSPADRKVSKQVQMLTANFVKYGDPTRTLPDGKLKWSTYDADEEKVMSVDVTSREVSFKHDVAWDTYITFLQNTVPGLPDGMFQ